MSRSLYVFDEEKNVLSNSFRNLQTLPNIPISYVPMERIIDATLLNDYFSGINAAQNNTITITSLIGTLSNNMNGIDLTGISFNITYPAFDGMAGFPINQTIEDFGIINMTILERNFSSVKYSGTIQTTDNTFWPEELRSKTIQNVVLEFDIGNGAEDTTISYIRFVFTA